MYYSISEAGSLAGEEQYILRYWEREFEELRPRKNRAGNRVYTGKDLAILMAIRKLLREDNLSIREAKKKITREYGIQPAAAAKSPAKNDKQPVSKSKRTAGTPKQEQPVNADNGAPKPPHRAMVALPRRDVIELCSLLKDMAILIQSL